MNDQIMPPEEQDPADPRGLGDVDSITEGGGPRDVVFHGIGLFNPWDLGPGRKSGRQGGFRHANY